MKIAAKLLCLALCTALPLGYAGAAWSDTSPKKHSVKAKVKKHKIRAKKSSAPRISARKAKSTHRVIAQPKPAAPMVTASQVLSVPAAVVAPIVVAVEPAVVKALSAPVNPYLAQPHAAVSSANPYMPQPPMPWPEQTVSAPTVNPYLVKAVQTAVATPGNPYQAAPASVPAVKLAAVSASNTYLASTPSAQPVHAPAPLAAQPVQASPAQQAAQAEPVTSVSANKSATLGFLASLDPKQGLSDLLGGLRNSIPLLNDQDLLPTIKKVYPTGEKPLVILSFKCPTEMIGVTPPPMKALHELINLGFDGLNKTNMLSFNLQQVCN
jgi:hypothetical protein